MKEFPENKRKMAKIVFFCHEPEPLLKSRRIPRHYGGDECGAGVRGMQSPSLLFQMPRL